MSCKFFSISTYDYIYSEYMPTLHWWIGASSVSPYVITITWGITSGIIIHHWSIAYELFIYCSSLIYFSVATVTITIKPKLLPLLLPPLPLLLPYYFATKYFAVDTKLSRCGWIDNSTANTWEYSLAPLVSNQQICVEYSTLENCCDPIYLWVIKTFLWRRCRGA